MGGSTAGGCPVARGGGRDTPVTTFAATAATVFTAASVVGVDVASAAAPSETKGGTVGLARGDEPPFGSDGRVVGDVIVGG